MKIAFSVSATTIACDLDFVPFVEWTARAYDIERDRVIVGVKRYAMFASRGMCCDALKALRAMGVRIAFEEIGSSYANVLAAQQLRPDYIKTDCTSEDRLRSIVELASGIGARTIAAGVATGQEFMASRQAGIDLVQGALLARPYAIQPVSITS